MSLIIESEDHNIIIITIQKEDKGVQMVTTIARTAFLSRYNSLCTVYTVKHFVMLPDVTTVLTTMFQPKKEKKEKKKISMEYGLDNFEVSLQYT